MCRIAGFLGSPTALAAVLSEPSHALRTQAREPRELPPGMLGSDGYGFAWLDEQSGKPARYRQTLPIWSDPNLDTLAPHIRARCFVAATRTAEDNMPVSLTNTPPFVAERTMVVHNGSITNFYAEVSERLRARLDEPRRRAVQGNTDSEYLAAVLFQLRGETLEARVREALREVSVYVREADTCAQLNLVASDGEQLVATRYAVGQSAPSLYCAQTERGVFIASEPLCEEQTWTRVPEGSLVCARPQADGNVTWSRSPI